MNNLSTFSVYKGDRNVDIFFVKRTVMLIFSGAYFLGIRRGNVDNFRG